jgi:agmatine deiminase
MGLNLVRIPYNVYDNKNNDQANGDYINYLQMDNLVIVPTFGLKEDDEVIRQFEDLFAEQRIETVKSNEIANDGGV